MRNKKRETSFYDGKICPKKSKKKCTVLGEKKNGAASAPHCGAALAAPHRGATLRRCFAAPF